jgi:signal transduction histidine kinase
MAPVNDLGTASEVRWRSLMRRAPYVVLALATLLAGLTMSLFDRGPASWAAAAVLVVVAAAAHAWVVDRRWDRRRAGPDRASEFYILARTVAAAVLTGINPFFAVFASLGYFDTVEHVRRRLVTPVMLLTALTLAGAQSGGLPPANGAQATAFVGLFALNAGAALFFVRMERDEQAVAATRVATIDELQRTNARLADALAENADLHAALLQRARDAGRHEERERLALEIHDTIAQSLVGVVTQLQAATDDPDPVAVANRVVAATELARTALVDARRSVEGLMPAQLDDADAPAALDQLLHDWAARTGARAELVVTGPARPLSDDAEAVLLRVAGECLANITRHARATRVGVTLSFFDGEVLLDVRDDGVGFSAAVRDDAGTAGLCFGLRGMRQRAERVGGEVFVESEPGAGTAVSLRLPVTRG